MGFFLKQHKNQESERRGRDNYFIVLYARFGFSEGLPTILPVNHSLCKVDVVRALPDNIHSLNPVIYVKMTSQLTIEVVCYGAVKITQRLGNLGKIKPTRLPQG